MTAPQSVVDAVMIERRCRLAPAFGRKRPGQTTIPWRCRTHNCSDVPHRGCEVAVDAADAAFAASLRAVIDRLTELVGVEPEAVETAVLRRWADESEA